MKVWHWISIALAGIMAGAVVWWVLSRPPARPAARVPAFAAPISVQFAQAGEYAQQKDYRVLAVCSSRGDLLYLTQGRGGFSWALGIAAIPGGCSRSAGGALPTIESEALQGSGR